MSDHTGKRDMSHNSLWCKLHKQKTWQIAFVHFLFETREKISIESLIKLHEHTKRQMQPTMWNKRIYLYGKELPEWYVYVSEVDATQADFKSCHIHPFTRRKEYFNICNMSTIPIHSRWSWTIDTLLCICRPPTMHNAINVLLYCVQNKLNREELMYVNK